MTEPLVSVVTATWQRPGLLTGRCIPSVQAQTYPNIEHIVFSDGPDDALAEMARSGQLPVRFFELSRHPRSSRFGHYVRLMAIALARGDYIAYLDDDDAFRPHHISALMSAMTATLPAPGFAYSCAMMHTPSGDVRIGDGPLARGRIAPGSTMLHHRSTLEVSTWRNEDAPDWHLVQRWAEAGVFYASVGAVTVDYYPGSIGDHEYVPVSLPPGM